MHSTTTNAFQSVVASKYVPWACLVGKSGSGINPSTKDGHWM